MLYPKEITISGTTYPEASEIFGGHPVLPYQVSLTAALEDARLSGRRVMPVVRAYRIIEGKKEAYEWPGKSYQRWSTEASDYPDVRTKYFRNSDDSRRAAETLYELIRFIVKSDLSAFSAMNVSSELSTGGQETTREITEGAERTEYFWGSVMAGTAHAEIRASVNSGSVSLSISSLSGVNSDAAVEYSDFLGRGEGAPANSSYDYVLYAGRKGMFTTTSMEGSNSTITLGTKTYSIKTIISR